MRHYGYVKLNRDILNWRWFGNHNTSRLFIILLLMANYSECEFESHTIKRGQVVTSLNRLCDVSGLTRSQVRTSLEHLVLTQDITQTKTPKYTIITIENYEKFASITHSTAQRSHNSDTAVAQQSHQYNKYNNKNNYNNYKNRSNDYVDEEAEERYRIFESKSLFND